MADFNSKRYMTSGIQTEIDLSLQLIMWDMIDENIQKKLNMDYLQIFELSPIWIDGTQRQSIVHKQEVPKRKSKITINTDIKPISAKIFVIDSEEYVTMLLASEY